MQRIEATAHAPAQGWNPYVGHGVIDPLAAVTGELAPGERVKVNHQSVSIDPLPTPPTPDNRSRDTALVGAGTVGTLALLTLLASMPLRRVIRRHLPERQNIDP
jgi:membrane-anchored mycosin MYCP